MNLKIEYGILPDYAVDVTDVCLQNAEEGIITIPSGDQHRCDVFGKGDPLYNVYKKVYVTTDSNTYEFSLNYEIMFEPAALSKKKTRYSRLELGTL